MNAREKNLLIILIGVVGSILLLVVVYKWWWTPFKAYSDTIGLLESDNDKNEAILDDFLKGQVKMQQASLQPAYHLGEGAGRVRLRLSEADVEGLRPGSRGRAVQCGSAKAQAGNADHERQGGRPPDPDLHRPRQRRSRQPGQGDGCHAKDALRASHQELDGGPRSERGEENQRQAQHSHGGGDPAGGRQQECARPAANARYV